MISQSRFFGCFLWWHLCLRFQYSWIHLKPLYCRYPLVCFKVTKMHFISSQASILPTNFCSNWLDWNSRVNIKSISTMVETWWPTKNSSLVGKIFRFNPLVPSCHQIKRKKLANCSRAAEIAAHDQQVKVLLLLWGPTVSVKHHNTKIYKCKDFKDLVGSSRLQP